MSDQDEVELVLHEALRRAGVYGTQSISAATMEVMATLRDLGIVGNGAALRAKLAEQTERADKASLTASREATVSKVSLDQANQIIDSLTEERDRWTDDCLKTRAERDQLKRERDAAQAEAAALRTELERIRDEVLPHEGIRWIATLCEKALATPSTAGEPLRPTLTEAAAAVSQAVQNIRARLDATPSTAVERWKELFAVIREMVSKEDYLDAYEPLRKVWAALEKVEVMA